MHSKTIRQGILTVAAITAIAAPQAQATLDPLGTAKNVILFVSDGASFGAWDMADYWEYGTKGQQAFDAFDVKLGMTTESLGRETSNPGVPVYDPVAAWDTTPTGDNDYFAGYQRVKQYATDSAAAGTALATGQKTIDGYVSVDVNGNPMTTISEVMKNFGKSVGVVSSVGFTHATPAVFGSQNISRGNYLEIGNQMINEDTLDLIMGAGHPFYDNDGVLRDSPVHDDWFYESDWNALMSDNAPMEFIDAKADFAALADGTLEVDGRLMGLAQVANTLQYSRDFLGDDPSVASGWAQIENVPSLEMMTQGALNHLGKDEDGMFLMIEGGAVDWAAHGNWTEWVIEEQVDFNRSVRAAVEWVMANSSFDETLIIVLTDHGNGLPLGPDSDTIPFQQITSAGQGVVPDVLWHSGSHTTENTPLWAHGAGAELFYDLVVGVDEGMRDVTGFNDGQYVDITAVYPVMVAAAVPEPSTIALIALGALAIGFLVIRRRR